MAQTHAAWSSRKRVLENDFAKHYDYARKLAEDMYGLVAAKDLGKLELLVKGLQSAERKRNNCWKSLQDWVAMEPKPDQVFLKDLEDWGLR